MRAFQARRLLNLSAGVFVRHTHFSFAVMLASASGWAAAPPVKSPPSAFDRIDALLAADPGVNSVAKLLAKLPDKALLNDYVLMRDSKSNQEATDDEPRVILFGEKSDLVVAYDRTGKTLEGMEFDRSAKRWNFFQVRFDAGKALTAKNPASCAGCHTSSLRPNWESYPLWPGAYGANESLKGDEKKKYDAFVAKAGSNPLYKSLPGLPDHYASGRGAEPNTRFTATLASRNFLRIAEQIRKLPNYPVLRYAIAAASIPSCFQIGKDAKVSLPFLPEGDFRTFVERSATEKIAKRKETFGVRNGMTMDVTRAIVEAAGNVESVHFWSTLFSTKDFVARARKSDVSPDPFSSGLGGAERLLSQGLVEVDETVARIVKPFLSAYFDKMPPAKDETPGEKRARELSEPLFRLPRIHRRNEKSACAALTKASLEALAKFQWKPTNTIAVAPSARETHAKK